MPTVKRGKTSTESIRIETVPTESVPNAPVPSESVPNAPVSSESVPTSAPAPASAPAPKSFEPRTMWENSAVRVSEVAPGRCTLRYLGEFHEGDLSTDQAIHLAADLSQRSYDSQTRTRLDEIDVFQFGGMIDGMQKSATSFGHVLDSTCFRFRQSGDHGIWGDGSLDPVPEVHDGAFPLRRLASSLVE